MLEEKYKKLNSDVPESEPTVQESEDIVPNQHPPNHDTDTSKQNPDDLHAKVDPEIDLKHANGANPKDSSTNIASFSSNENTRREGGNVDQNQQGQTAKNQQGQRFPGQQTQNRQGQSVPSQLTQNQPGQPILDPPNQNQQGQPIPGQPTQNQPVPGQPTQNQPDQPIPGQPTQNQPGQPISGQPTQNQPGQPTQNQPGQSIPDQPTQEQPGQPIPASPNQNQQGQPIPGQPTQNQPIPGQPTQNQQGQPTQNQPVPDQPGQPIPGQPTQNQPRQPILDQRTQNQPGQPIPDQPIQNQPGQPILDQPIQNQQGQPIPGQPIRNHQQPMPAQTETKSQNQQHDQQTQSPNIEIVKPGGVPVSQQTLNGQNEQTKLQEQMLQNQAQQGGSYQPIPDNFQGSPYFPNSGYPGDARMYGVDPRFAQMNPHMQGHQFPVDPRYASAFEANRHHGLQYDSHPHMHQYPYGHMATHINQFGHQYVANQDPSNLHRHPEMPTQQVHHQEEQLRESMDRKVESRRDTKANVDSMVPVTSNSETIQKSTDVEQGKLAYMSSITGTLLW